MYCILLTYIPCINEPLARMIVGNPIPRTDVNKLIDWFIVSWTSPQRPFWGQKNAAVVEMFKQEWTYEVSKKSRRCVEVVVSGGSNVLSFPFVFVLN